MLKLNTLADAEEDFDLVYSRLIGKVGPLFRGIMLQPIAIVDSMSAHSYAGHDEFTAVFRRERDKINRTVLRKAGLLNRNDPCKATTIGFTAIDPQGYLYMCNHDLGRPSRAFGNVADPAFRDLSNWQPWISFDWFRGPECRDCKVLPICLGGCPHARMATGPDYREGLHCVPSIREDVEHRIRDMVADRAGV